MQPPFYCPVNRCGLNSDFGNLYLVALSGANNVDTALEYADNGFAVRCDTFSSFQTVNGVNLHASIGGIDCYTAVGC